MVDPGPSCQWSWGYRVSLDGGGKTHHDHASNRRGGRWDAFDWVPSVSATMAESAASVQFGEQGPFVYRSSPHSK